MKNTIIVLLVLFSIFVNAQVNKFGTPQITYYSDKDYNSETQNWAAVKDSRDVMFFGNNSNVLRFDGSNWKKYSVSNKSTVYSLDVDTNNIVYVGAVNQFGCLLPKLNGDLEYVSLSNQIDSTVNFAEVWKTYVVNNEVYFCTWDYIFIYSNLKFKKKIKLPKGSFHSFVLNNEIFVTHYGLGLLKIDAADSVVAVNGGDKFIEKSIFGILPFGTNSLMITTGRNGVYIFNKDSDSIHSFLSDTASIIASNGNLYNVIQLNDGNYAFSTIYAGLLVVNNKGEVVYHLDDKNGLQDNIVTDVFQSENGPLWLTLNNGIARIDINIPVNYFNLSKDIDGTLNNMILFKDVLYLATDAGVYYISNNGFYPELKKTIISEQTWGFKHFKTKNKDVIIVATNHGLFEITDTANIKDIETQIINEDLKAGSIRTKIIHKLNNKPVILFAKNNKIRSLTFNGENWSDLKKFNIDFDLSDLKEDNDGNLWFVSDFNGVYKARYDNDSLVILSHFDKKSGFVSLKGISSTLYNNTVCFSTEEGVFTINEETNKLEKKKILGSEISKAVVKFVKLRYNNYIIIINESNEKKEIEKDNKFIFIDGENNRLDSITFNSLPNSKIDAYFAELNENTIYVGVGKEIYIVNREINNRYTKPPPVIFRKVTSKDSTIFQGVFTKNNTDATLEIERVISLYLSEEGKLVLDFNLHEITFKFSVPYYYNSKEIEYSYFMDGDDEEWSQWSKNDYDNEKLNEGNYTLKVKARNAYGIESDISEYSFTINAPWYRTKLAYVIYAIFIIGFIVLIVYLNNRRLIKDKILLEKIVKQRTAEVVAQKEEIEVQKEEIESQRDLVLEQKDKIEQIHEEITDSIHYAERIQRAILPAEEHVNKAVPEHFILFKPKDIVSGDYYWATVLENTNKHKKDLIGKLVITAADCTGHGVPGAFMSMLGVSFLNEIVNEKQIDQSHQILNMMRENVIASLQQTGADGEQKDGMDMALMVIDFENNKVQFSGANNPLYVIRKKSEPELKVLTSNTVIRLNEVEGSEYIIYEIKGDNMPIAIHVIMNEFKLNEFEVMSGDTLYMFSDGYADQFGGVKGKKFKYKPFKRLFLENQQLSMIEQKEVLETEIEAWKAFVNPVTKTEFEQIDDIVVIGVKIP